MDSYPIRPVSGPVSGTVEVPGSKSITNRALIFAAMADGESILEGALFSDDTRYMAEALNLLGIHVHSFPGDCRFTVEGLGGRIPAAKAHLFVGNSGTTARFLTAFLAAGSGTYQVDGVARMRERPIEDLLAALRQLGVDASSDLGTGCPPLTVRTRGLRGGLVRIRADVSSQYLTGLLMAAPLAENETVIEIEGSVSSAPYIEITLRMMEQWGASVQTDGYLRFTIAPRQTYRPQRYQVEADASAASYFMAAAAVTGGRVRIPGLSRGSLQGDVAFANVLTEMGCTVRYGADFVEIHGGPLRGVDVDMNPISDTVMTLAAIAPFAATPTTIRNVAHIRHKETDRITAVCTELARLGVEVVEHEDGLTIRPCARMRSAAIQTYDDHRMAMSFAITGLRSPGITILDPSCVRKTFPHFFEVLETLSRTAPQA